MPLYSSLVMDSDSALLTLQEQAIKAALSANWEDALKANLEIIAVYPQNVEAINRAARAHFELGDLKTSKKLYEEALVCDPYNQIAAKFLKRIASLKGNGVKPNGLNGHVTLSSDMFIKEPGKSKLVNLNKVAEPQKLSRLSTGEEVTLNLKNHAISVTDYAGEYLGVLPDDVSHRLIRFMKGGNKYQAIIKSIRPNAVTILLKELVRAAKFRNQPSFPETTNFTYSSDHISLSDDENPLTNEDEEESSD